MLRGIFARAVGYVPLLIVTLGVAARLRQFVFNRSLWLDEAAVAVNIVGRNFGGLLRPLEYLQVAPIGFLWTEKVLVSIIGNTDLVLRIGPLVAGLLALVLMAKLAEPMSTLLEIVPGGLALALFALSGRLIYYSSEVKQYSLDVLLAVTLLILARRCWQAESKAADFGRLGCAAAVSVWFSHPAIFVICGILASLGISRLLAKDWRGLWLVAGGTVATLASFGLVYLTVLRNAADPMLTQFWQFAFAPLPPWAYLPWYSRNFLAALGEPAGLWPHYLAGALILTGYVRILVQKWELAAGLAVSVLAAIAASALQKYPLNGRLLLFGLPVAYLLVGGGLRAIQGVLSRLNRPVALGFSILVAAVLLYRPSLQALNTFERPYVGEDMRSVMAYVRQHRMIDDVIYVNYLAYPAFKYYAPQYGFASEQYMYSINGLQDYEANMAMIFLNPEGYFSEIAQLRGRRVWFVFSHDFPKLPTSTRAYLARLNQVGLRLEQFNATGASAYLYSLEPAK